MEYGVGDKVVHWAYGPGEIVQLDEKVLSGRSASYYVVQIDDMTIWVPHNTSSPSSLRPPTPASEFERLFAILSSPGNPLSSDRLERKTQLMDMMRAGTLESICRVIRDLASFRQTKKLNDNDSLILERAQKFLLSEWELSLSVPVNQAEHALNQLLGENYHKR